MSKLQTIALPDWQRDRLTLLLDALDGVPSTDAERASLTWLSGWELRTVQNVAAVIIRARQSGPAQTATETTGHDYAELSSAITRALQLTRDAGDALTTAGQALTGLSGALAEVVAAVAATPELAATSRRRVPPVARSGDHVA